MKIHLEGAECPGCEKKLLTAHPSMRDWFHARKKLHPELHVSWAWRGKDAQNGFLKLGVSEKAWPGSKHNRMLPIDPSKPFDPANENDPNARPESLALDLFQQINDKAVYSPKFMTLLNRESEEGSIPVLWGGRFKSLGDFCHFELHEAA